MPDIGQAVDFLIRNDALEFSGSPWGNVRSSGEHLSGHLGRVVSTAAVGARGGAPRVRSLGAGYRREFLDQLGPILGGQIELRGDDVRLLAGGEEAQQPDVAVPELRGSLAHAGVIPGWARKSLDGALFLLDTRYIGA